MKNLRELFDKTTYSSYSYFINNVVKPAIGNRGLHVDESGRRKEYTCSQRNYALLCRKLGVPLPHEDDGIFKVAEALANTLPRNALAKIIHTAVKGQTVERFPLSLQIDKHPFSVNMQYENGDGRLQRTAEYNAWREEMTELLEAMPLNVGDLDTSIPMHIELEFTHRPSFDTDNFIKSAIDALADHLRFNDRNIRSYKVKGVASRDPNAWGIHYKLRNL